MFFQQENYHISLLILRNENLSMKEVEHRSLENTVLCGAIVPNGGIERSSTDSLRTLL